MRWLVRFVENHLWFVERSREYNKGMPRFQYLLRYPIAWIRFMWYAMKTKSIVRNTTDTNSSDSSRDR